jgi:hypothetical protein
MRSPWIPLVIARHHNARYVDDIVPEQEGFFVFQRLPVNGRPWHTLQFGVHALTTWKGTKENVSLMTPFD